MMNIECLTHRQPAPDCTACGLAALAEMTRQADVVPVAVSGTTRGEECRACGQPIGPAGWTDGAGFRWCGSVGAQVDRDAWRICWPARPWPGGPATADARRQGARGEVS